MVDDISNLRPLCDILVVSLHKGILQEPIKLADYEFQITHAAIDAGADLIFGTHAHRLRGIEFYKGKAIFHCLGNLVTVMTTHRSQKPPRVDGIGSTLRTSERWFEPDPDYPTYPFPSGSTNAMIAKFIVEGKQISRISYLPCLVNKKGQPELLKHDKRGQEVFEYMDKITRGAGLNAQYEWEGDEIVIHA